MIKVKEYRGHIRNWKVLCGELGIAQSLSREAREEQILIKAYEAWGMIWRIICTECLLLHCGMKMSRSFSA